MRIIKGSGVYAIINKINGKAYIGSTIYGFLSRWSAHKSYLRNKKHQNKHLQNAYDKYGIDNFDFRILEQVDDLNQVRIKEQEWMERWSIESGCYNLMPAAGPEGDRAAMHLADEHRTKLSISGAKTYDCALISPDGTIYERITHLEAFCEEHGLRSSTMCWVISGRHLSHRGWRRLDTELYGTAAQRASSHAFMQSPEYRQQQSVRGKQAMQDPDYKERCTKTLRDPAVRERARQSTIRNVYRFLSPDGVTHEVRDLRAFCEEHGLNLPSMRCVANLKNKLRSHKGWVSCPPRDMTDA